LNDPARVARARGLRHARGTRRLAPARIPLSVALHLATGGAAACLGAGAGACGGSADTPPEQRRAPSPAATAPTPAPAPPEVVVRSSSGEAIWYGGSWQGKRTASGERFDKGALTAAHRSLPLGTRVRVTNLDNGRQVVVRINDRGPYGADRRRIIDVSQAAARQLGFEEVGSTRVRVDVLASVTRPGAAPPPASPSTTAPAPPGR
jgi:rare lipoprotein A